MTRVRRGYTARRHRSYVLTVVAGSRQSSCYRAAATQAQRALVYSYRHRRLMKRAFRSTWIARINAAAHREGSCYHRVVHLMHRHKRVLNRRLLSQWTLLHGDVNTSKPLETRARKQKHSMGIIVR